MLFYRQLQDDKTNVTYKKVKTSIARTSQKRVLKLRTLKSVKLFFVFFLLSSLHSVQGQSRLYLDDDRSTPSFTLYTLGKWREAIEAANKELEGEEVKIESYIALSSSHLALKDYKDSYTIAKKARDDSQQKYNPELLQLQAVSCYHLGRNLEALSLLQTYIRVSAQEKDIANIYYYMGEIYARLTQFNRADMALSTALRIRPSEVEWWVRLGYVREKARIGTSDAKSTQYALEAYRKALTLERNYADALAGIKRLQGNNH